MHYFSGIFINVNTNDIYEVRKNPETGKLEIYKGGSAMYLSTPEMDPNGNDVERVNEIPEMTDEELFQEKIKIIEELEKLNN